MGTANIDTSVDRQVIFTRTIDAPRALVFKAWTDPKHMAQWWGPHHFTNPVCEMDVRQGGSYRIVMRAPDGAEYPCCGVYGEIVPPEQLVMVMCHDQLPEEWHDALNPDRDKAAGRPALQAVITVTFAEQTPGGGKTKLTIQIGYDSAAIRDAFLNRGMSEGWSQSLEKLESLVGRRLRT